ncbi:MAG TPA: methylated-DNA--[protein]-cysteine S-methyltransferase [Puia sp.]|nr:methylated-DNA--[protein]-cysteine S-methyltransferase [Puia sp.]
MAITIKNVLPAIGALDKTTPEEGALTQDQVVSLEQWAGLPFTEIKTLLSPKHNKLLLKTQPHEEAAGDRAKTIVERHFPGSVVVSGTDAFQRDALAFIQGETDREVHLHVKGTEEQLKIWAELIKVPEGMLTSYGALGKNVQCMAQDVGVAMGDNRVALLIPCHRVIKSTGEIGLYHYGPRLKRAIILREARRRSGNGSAYLIRRFDG